MTESPQPSSVDLGLRSYRLVPASFWSYESLGWLSVALALCGCRSEPRRSAPSALPALNSLEPNVSALSRPADAPLKAPSTLLELPQSAYGTQVFVGAEGTLLLTPTDLIEFSGLDVPQRRELPLGAGAALMGHTVVYWHDGFVRAVQRGGGNVRKLHALKEQPRRLIASEDRFAWLGSTPQGRSVVATFQRGRVAVLYESPRELVALAMLQDWVFFVEPGASGSWEVVGVSAHSKSEVRGRPHTGRTPSRLVAAHDQLYFYDGPTRSVLRLSPDLRGETLVAKGVVCSPLSVGVNVVCARVGGLLEAAEDGRPPKALAVETEGPITAIAASEREVVWVVDAGKEKLALRRLLLAPAP